MNRKIVVIDDERSVQDVVRGYLERDGYLVCVAGNGREGLAVALVGGLPTSLVLRTLDRSAAAGIARALE